jgi:hypothetical protein
MRRTLTLPSVSCADPAEVPTGYREKVSPDEEVGIQLTEGR